MGIVCVAVFNGLNKLRDGNMAYTSKFTSALIKLHRFA